MKTRRSVHFQVHNLAKALLITMGALSGLVPIKTHATNTVSRPVCFVRISISPSNQLLSAVPLNAFTNTVPGVLRAQLTGGSTSTVSDNVLKWDNSSQSYLTFWKDLSGVWHQDAEPLEATNTLSAGDGFWIVNRQTSTQAVYLAGHVVLDPTNTVLLGTLLNLFAYPYSTKVGLNGTELLNDGAVGSSVQTNADQATETTSNTISWLYVDTNSPLHEKWVLDTNTISSLELLLGRGYWYNRTGTNALSWNEARPYPNPFPSDGAPPFITNVTFNGAGDEATLSINTLGTTGEMIEVYYQDVSATGAFHTTNGWSVAVLGLSVGGSPNITWTDDGSGGRGAIDGEFARFYLVGRGDIDADSDGLPDSREVYIYHTNPNSSDTDGDGMPDGWETQNGLDPLANDAGGDPDSDDLDNLGEYQNNTDPNDADTDGDALPDGWEVDNDLNARSDSVTNGLSAWWQYSEGSGLTASNSAGSTATGYIQNMDNSNWTTGLLGGAIQFDGINEYIAVTQSTAIVTGGSFTVTALVNLNTNLNAGWPTVLSDARQRTDDFTGTSTSVPPGWTGGLITGTGAGTANWSVPGSGNHSNRAVFGGTGGSTNTASRNSFIVKAITIGSASSNRPQEWAFNASYDSSNTSEGSDDNRWRFWLWADGTNLDTANGYAIEYGKDGASDRLELYRMASGSKSGGAILVSGTNVTGGDVQYSARVRRDENGVWRLWDLWNKSTNNVFPTNSPVGVTADEQVGTNNAQAVTGAGYVGFQGFVRTSSSSSRQYSLDDLSINGQITGFDLRYRDSLGFLTGDSTNSTQVTVSNAVQQYLGQWQSVAARYDGTNIALFVEGRPSASAVGRFAAALSTSLWVGRELNETTNSYLKGLMDDLRIYRGALTTNEIRSIYEQIADMDADGLNNLEEYQNGTDPWSSDTDSDGLSDSAELVNNTNPLDSDSDDDGLSDGWEVAYGFNPRSDLLLSDLASWWKFDDQSGLVATNAVSTNYYGSLQNMDNSNWTTGLFGGALTFDGTNEFVQVSQTAAVVTNGPFTVAAVTYLDGDYLGLAPSLISDMRKIVNDFASASTGVPPGWVGGAVTGSGATNGAGDGTARWSVETSGVHAGRALFSGSGSADSTTRSRNSSTTRPVTMPPASAERPQEWAFNVSYDSSDTSDASDQNKLRVWLWASSTNLSSASGYFVEYGRDGVDDRLQLFRIVNGNKDQYPILQSHTNATGRDVQFSVHMRRNYNGNWRMWSLWNTTTNNLFPTNDPMQVLSNERSGWNSTINVDGSGHLGFEVFLRTGSASARTLALDDLSVKDEGTGFALSYADSLWAQTGNETNTAVASATDQAQPYLGRWRPLVLTYDGTNTALYVGGTLASTVAGRFQPAAQSLLYIGRGHLDPAESYLKGRIDDLRLYSRALNSNEVRGVYDAANDLDNDGLINLSEAAAGTNPTLTDTDGDGMSDGWEVQFGLNPLVADATSDPDGDGLLNVNEFTRNLSPFVWNGVQDIAPQTNTLLATGSNTAIALRFYSYEAQQVTIRLIDFQYAIDPVSGDFTGYSTNLITQIVTNAIVGTNTVTWTGLDTNGLLHGYDVVMYEVLSTETVGGTNTALFAPIYVEGNAELYVDYQTLDASPFENRAGEFTTGDNGMAKLFVHSTDYPSLIENRVVDRRLYIDDWIPFLRNGSIGTSEGNPFPVNTIVNRIVPTNSVIFLQQHATVSNYSVEAYRTTPALAGVVHAVFTLDRDCKVTFNLYDPDLNAYPVVVRLTNGTDVVVTNYTMTAGYHDMEFVAVDRSGAEPLLFRDRDSLVNNTYSFRFAIDDTRTGRRTIKWAGVTIVP